jgi:hypothetical protein
MKTPVPSDPEGNDDRRHVRPKDVCNFWPSDEAAAATLMWQPNRDSGQRSDGAAPTSHIRAVAAAEATIRWHQGAKWAAGDLDDVRAAIRDGRIIMSFNGLVLAGQGDVGVPRDRPDPHLLEPTWLQVLMTTMRLFYERKRARSRGLPPSWLTGVAVFLAGRKHRAVREEWRGHLYGWPGSELSRREQIRTACGFLRAAVVLRRQDAADLAWRPVDAVLGSRFLSNVSAWLPVMALLMAIVRHDGRFGLVHDADAPAVLTGFLYGAIHAGRKYRGIKPKKPEKQRAEE